MKLLPSSFLLFIYCSANAQFKDRIYSSTEESFKQDHYLVLNGEQVTLYGWAIEYTTGDTLFFRSTTKYSFKLTFEKFEYSKINPFIDLSNFKPDQTIEHSSIAINRYFDFIKYEGYKIYYRSVCDIYDSRSDQFIFELVN